MNYYNKKNLTKHQITQQPGSNLGGPNPMDMLMKMGLDPALIQQVMSGNLSGIPPEILSTIQNVLGQMSSGPGGPYTNEELENIAIQENGNGAPFPGNGGFSNNLQQLMELGKQGMNSMKEYIPAEYIPKQKGGQLFKKGGAVKKPQFKTGGAVKKQMPSVPKYKTGGQIGKSNYMQALRNFKSK